MSDILTADPLPAPVYVPIYAIGQMILAEQLVLADGKSRAWIHSATVGDMHPYLSQVDIESAITETLVYYVRRVITSMNLYETRADIAAAAAAETNQVLGLCSDQLADVYPLDQVLGITTAAYLRALNQITVPETVPPNAAYLAARSALGRPS